VIQSRKKREESFVGAGRYAIPYTLTRKRYTVQVRKAYCTCTKGAWLRFHSGGRAGSVVGADWRLRIGSPVAASVVQKGTRLCYELGRLPRA